MMMISKIAIIVNSLRQKRSDAELLALKIQKILNIEKVSVFMTEQKEDAISLANKAMVAGFDCIIGMGGDGTLNEIINGIQPEIHKDILIGLIPAGTANDFFLPSLGSIMKSSF